MNTNCKNCDRADCPTLTGASLVMHAGAQNRALADCAAHTVDWRTRYFTAEARATAAEAELAKLREGLPKWHHPSQWRWWLKTVDGQILGLTDDRDPRWPVWSRDEELGDADSFGAARRLVEAHHGLPVCEVLP